jgi:protein-tyrosine phosphatase
MMPDDRVLPLEGVHNFRDYGGYPVAGGGRLKRGTLWRSGQHFGATDTDLAEIAALGLASVHDLRTDDERSLHPCRRPESFAAAVFHPPVPSSQLAPHVAAATSRRAATTRQRTAEDTRTALRANYGKIASRPELIAAIRVYLADLAEARGPSLVNCMAGKDRTGVTVAMLHLAVGVHRDDILEDYLLTNTAGDPEARIAAGSATVAAMGNTMDEASIRVIMGVEAEYLENMFEMVDERYGSADAYLAGELGADAALRAKLRAVLVED